MKEIPRELMAGEVYEPKRRDDDLERNSQSTYRKAKEAFKRRLHTAQSMQPPLIHSVQGHLSIHL